jgi:hypothetical protein
MLQWHVREAQEHVVSAGDRFGHKKAMGLVAAFRVEDVAGELGPQEPLSVELLRSSQVMRSQDFRVGQISLRLVPAPDIAPIDHMWRRRARRHVDDQKASRRIRGCGDGLVYHRQRRVTVGASDLRDLLSQAIQRLWSHFDGAVVELVQSNDDRPTINSELCKITSSLLVLRPTRLQLPLQIETVVLLQQLLSNGSTNIRLRGQSQSGLIG